MKYKNIIKVRFPEIQLLSVVPMQLKFSIVEDHDEPTILLFETLFCTWECFSMGTELPTKVMLGQKLVVMQMTFLNNVSKKVGRLVLSRTSCCNRILPSVFSPALTPQMKAWLAAYVATVSRSNRKKFCHTRVTPCFLSVLRNSQNRMFLICVIQI
jgi:hypothetical protein